VLRPVLLGLLRLQLQALQLPGRTSDFRHQDPFIGKEELGVRPALALLSHEILDVIPPGRRATEFLTAHQIAGHAERELVHYRLQFPELSAQVHVSETTVGVMVENGHLFIGLDTTIATNRIEPLLQHEIGVHILTHANGSAQPIRMLSQGLAGYE